MRNRLSVTVALAVAAAVLAGFPAAASGADWVYFATTARGTHYYDRETLQKAGNTVRVREKTVYSEGGKRAAQKFLAGTGEYKGQKPDHVVTLSEFDCKEAKARSLSMVIYDIDGRRIAGSPEGGTAWGTLVPETLHERLFQQVCP